MVAKQTISKCHRKYACALNLCVIDPYSSILASRSGLRFWLHGLGTTTRLGLGILLTSLSGHTHMHIMYEICAWKPLCIRYSLITYGTWHARNWFHSYGRCHHAFRLDEAQEEAFDDLLFLYHSYIHGQRRFRHHRKVCVDSSLLLFTCGWRRLPSETWLFERVLKM